ncbi:hypothetical protein [Nocardia sp. NPDC020380]
MRIPQRLGNARHLSEKMLRARRIGSADRAEVHYRRVSQEAWRGAR